MIGIGVMQANHSRTDPLAKVQIASVQTFARRGVPPAALAIVEECHIRSKTIEQLMLERPDVFFVGLSASPWTKGLGLVWQDLVVPCTVPSLIEQGLLSRSRIYAPDIPDLSRLPVERGEFAEAQLAEVMGEAKLVGSVVQTWLEKGEDRPTLVFGVNRAHALQLSEEFLSAGIAAAYVDGTVDSVMRRRIAGEFRAGAVRVICSVRAMTTGVDLPGIM